MKSKNYWNTTLGKKLKIEQSKHSNVAINFEKDDSHNFATDFDVGELLLSGISYLVFWKLCEFNKEIEEGGNNGDTKNLSFLEEMLNLGCGLTALGFYDIFSKKNIFSIFIFKIYKRIFV
jgi:hypothetical protein